MNTLTISTYQYDELNAKAQEAARDWFREASIGDNYFAQYVEEDARQVYAFCGFAIKEIHWSGFSSQGDGACFTGDWSAGKVDAAALRQHAPEDQELHRIAAECERIALANPTLSATIKQQGHYSHEYCTDFDFDFGDAPESTDDAPENELMEAARDAMRWIYKQLESAWEYENSDEQIAEAIRANEYAFTEGGKRSVVL